MSSSKGGPTEDSYSPSGLDGIFIDPEGAEDGSFVALAGLSMSLDHLIDCDNVRASCETHSKDWD